MMAIENYKNAKRQHLTGFQVIDKFIIYKVKFQITSTGDIGLLTFKPILVKIITLPEPESIDLFVAVKRDHMFQQDRYFVI